MQFLVATLHFAPSGVWLHFCALYPLHSVHPGLSSALCSLVSAFVYSALGHHALLLLHGAVMSLLNVNCATKPERMVRPRRRCGGGATHTNLRTHTSGTNSDTGTKPIEVSISSLDFSSSDAPKVLIFGPKDMYCFRKTFPVHFSKLKEKKSLTGTLLDFRKIIQPEQ